MINYPHNIKNKTILEKNTQKSNSAKRGMSLEEDLNSSNSYYLAHDIACIHKKPTPVQVVKVDYPKRSAARISEAYYKQPSTTDYNGVYKGYYLDFEAKETRNKTSFVFANIHSHQIQHLESVIKQKGIAFFIIKFTVFDEVYVISAQIVINMIKNGLKSISYDTIKQQGLLVEKGYQPRIDYLKFIDKIIKRGE